MTRAFVLTGGGALGATQSGMLQALFAHGVEPDFVVGTSVGALNAAFIARRPTYDSAVELEHLWYAASRNLIFPIRPRTLVLGITGRRDHLVASDGLASWVRGHLDYDDFADTSVPLHVVATDLESGNAVVLSAGALMPALLASCALPGIFPPVHIDGRVLVDGGISADVPALQAEAIGADEIWVLPTSGAERVADLPRGALEVLLRSIGIVLGHVTRDHLSQLGPNTTVHVLPAPAVSNSSILDFDHTAELVSEGRLLAESYVRQVSRRAAGQ